MDGYDHYNFRSDLYELRLSSKEAAKKLGTTARKVCDYANGEAMPAEIVVGITHLMNEEYAFRMRTGRSSDGRSPAVTLYAVEG